MIRTYKMQVRTKPHPTFSLQWSYFPTVDFKLMLRQFFFALLLRSRPLIWILRAVWIPINVRLGKSKDINYTQFEGLWATYHRKMITLFIVFPLSRTASERSDGISWLTKKIANNVKNIYLCIITSTWLIRSALKSPENICAVSINLPR